MQGFIRSYEANRSMHESVCVCVYVSLNKNKASRHQYTIQHDTTRYDWIHLHGNSIVLVRVCVLMRAYLSVCLCFNYLCGDVLFDPLQIHTDSYRAAEAAAVVKFPQTSPSKQNMVPITEFSSSSWFNYKQLFVYFI